VKRAQSPESVPEQSPHLNLSAGTSGWAYPTWKPGFYPANLAPKKFLGFYASHLNSVEVNYTFRALPTPKQIADWLTQTPANFHFSFKAPQRITHFSRLRDCHEQLVEFFLSIESVVRAGKLGLILFQLPPNFQANAELLTNFLNDPALTTYDGLRIAFEFRHESWFTEEIYALLRAHNAALCIAETDELQTPEVHTAATHTSFRLRRAGGYSRRQLAVFAKRFAALAATRQVYAYFKHEDEPTGALNARDFLALATKGKP
jgi:uncharacterized protein YecE (DUF72 family)